MHLIIQLLLDALILFILCHLVPGIKIRNYGTAVIVAMLIGILNAAVGLFLRLPVNMIALALIAFFSRLIITAVMIIITDRLLSGFYVRSFTTAVLLSCAMALLATLVGYFL